MQLFIRGFANTFAVEVGKDTSGAVLRALVAERMEVEDKSDAVAPKPAGGSTDHRFT